MFRLLMLLLSLLPLCAGAMEHLGLGVGLVAQPDGSVLAATVVQGQIRILKSADLGHSWQPWATVNATPEEIGSDSENPPQISRAPDGTLLVAWERRFAEPKYSGEVRFARAADGRHFNTPITLHDSTRRTSHAFVRQQLAADGRLWLVWIDGREKLDDPNYQGSALYARYSDDLGNRFAPEQRLVEHSCQCCRLALEPDGAGGLLLMWRQLFAEGVRDHALLSLSKQGVGPLTRVTFDNWQIDACPHHGPALNVDAQGRRHALWFSPHGEDGPLFYGQLTAGKVLKQRAVGGPQAGHGALLSVSGQVVLLWKEFDGQHTVLWAERLNEQGQSLSRTALARTDGPSDHPRLLAVGTQLLAVWNTQQQGLKGYLLP